MNGVYHSRKVDTVSSAFAQITDAKLLVRNIGINLIGQAGPLAITIFAIPILIKNLGIDRFGVLTLLWMLIGYLSLTDLGIGRALTKFVAERVGSEKEDEIPLLFWTSLSLMLIFGGAGTCLVILLSPWLVDRILNIPIALHREALYSFYLLGFCIPAVMTTAGIKGVLEAKQRFGFINAMNVIAAIFTFLGPLFVLLFFNSLLAIAAILVFGRVIILISIWLFCLYAIPSLRGTFCFAFDLVPPLLRFGGWIAVTNTIAPIMIYLDRFFVAAFASVASVAYYATPHSMITKLLVIPTAMATVLFPAFSASYKKDKHITKSLFVNGLAYLFMATFPITVIIVCFAHEVLAFWLGANFAQQATRVLQILAIGVFFNCLAQMPSYLVQGSGRPDLLAKLNLIELPFYLVLVYKLTINMGIEGTAISWSVRAIIDAIFIFIIARRVLREPSSK